MRENVTVENVFRFVQFRPPKPLDPDNTVELRSDTAVAELLKSLAPAERAAHANKYLESRTGELRDLANSAASRRIVDVATETEREGGTVAQFLERVSARDKDWLKTLAAQHLLLSDALLTTKFASQAALPQAMWWIRLFRLQAAVLARPGEAVLNSALREYLRLPLALPSMFELAVELNGRRPGSNRTPARRASEPSAAETSRREADAVARAFDEVVGLNRPGFLNSPSRDDSSGRRSSDGRAVPFSVTDAGLRRLTTPTREVLDRLGIDLGARSIHSVLAELDAEVARTAARAARTSVVLPSWEVNNQSAPGAQPYLRATGVADLLVVKQHLTGYERVDIAHIENVLIGETKNRTHRLLNRIEETFTEERETTLERETELETAERFEMNRETERTAQQDQQFGFGLTLSGKYGPSVEFSSNAQADVSTSEEETERSATEYAKDVVTRSLDRVVERVREEQIRRILREEEETNLHELKNDTKEHIIGVYQFLEKVYESQVFNYGIRQIFDFMIPEPASYIWHIEASPATDLDLPAAPPNLESRLPNALAVDHTNYLPIAALYGAEGITPPPPLFKSVSVSVKHGDTSGSEEEEPRSISSSEIDVPDGYQPTKAVVRLQGLTDDELSFSVTVGSQQQRWIQPPGGWDVGDDHKILSTALTYDLTGESYQYEDAGKLPFNVLAYESNTYAVAADFTFSRTDAALTEWQVKTYQAIAEAYRERLLQYQQRVEELKAEAEAEAGRSQFRFGAPPSQNAKTVKDELKKHCISVITRQWYDDFNALQDAVSPNPPEFDFVDAESEGDFIRFFEQAFEWDQMQFVFYPYFWARKDRWADRFKRQDVDPLFLDFLRAGAARAVVPVRPGFEVAVNHYLEQKALTGGDVIWNGEGDPPEINSPLYLPIVTEIKERTGASLGELPVGDPWPTNLPTPIVTLRREKTLPEWTRVNPLGWEWQEA